MPLSRALTILYKESSNPAAGAKWRELHDAVIDGAPLAVAMAKSPEVFPRIYTAMVEAGEAGGFLDVVLAQIADFQAREKELRAKVTAAMMYPAVLLTLAVGVVIFLLVFFIPRFQTLFEGFNAALPLLTRVIVGASDLLRHYGLYLLAVVGAAVWFGRAQIANDRTRRSWESILLRTPVVGPLMAQIAMARFCRMLGTLLGAGVTLVNGLNVARRSLGYQTLIDLVADSTERVKKGETLAASLAESRAIFGGSTLEMISVAEESGRLDTGTRPARGRDGSHARPAVENGRRPGRTHHAFRHRRVHRRDLHRHGDPHLYDSGLHQMKTQPPNIAISAAAARGLHARRNAARAGDPRHARGHRHPEDGRPQPAGQGHGGGVADLAALEMALESFEVDNGYFPKSGSLNDLLNQPANAPGWKVRT